MQAIRFPKGSLLILVSFLTLGVAFAVRVVFALVMPAMGNDTGWSPISLSAAMSVALVVSGVLTPVAGRLADKRGPRDALAFGLGLIAAGLAVLGVASAPWLVVAGFGLIAGGGFALVSTTVVSTAIATMFERNRGFATGIATSGESAGQFILIPAFALLLAASNWRVTVLAASALTVAVLLMVLMVMPRRGKPDQARAARAAGIGNDLKVLFGQPVFFALFASYFICGLTSTGFIESQFMPYVSFCGFAPMPTATAFGLLSLFNMFGMLASGWLTDRVNRVALLAGIYAVRGLSFAMLIGANPDYTTLSAFAVLFGLVEYSTIPVTVSLSASHLGVERLGFAFGLISGGHAVAAALGAIIGGALFEQTGGYAAIWLVGLWTSMGAAAITMSLTLMTGRRRATTA